MDIWKAATPIAMNPAQQSSNHGTSVLVTPCTSEETEVLNVRRRWCASAKPAWVGWSEWGYSRVGLPTWLGTWSLPWWIDHVWYLRFAFAAWQHGEDFQVKIEDSSIWHERDRNGWDGIVNSRKLERGPTGIWGLVGEYKQFWGDSTAAAGAGFPAGKICRACTKISWSTRPAGNNESWIQKTPIRWDWRGYKIRK